MGREIEQLTIDKICRKVIARIKNDLAPNICGDYAKGFNAYDNIVFAQECLGMSLDEMNPFLEKYIYDTIDICSEGTNVDNLDSVFRRLLEMMEEHSELKKIQKVYERF